MLGSSATSIELREAPVHEHHPLNDDEPSSPLAAKTSGNEPEPPFPEAVTSGKRRSTAHDTEKGINSSPSIDTGIAAAATTTSLNDDNDKLGNGISSLPAPSIASQPLERWNYPRSNRGRVLAAFWSLMVLGLGDSGYGAIIPYMRPYYDLSYTLISLVFLTPFVGYTLSAFSNNWIHTHFGQRGAALLCGGCHLVAFIVVSQHPPYPVLVIVYMLAGFGNGIGDAAWNAFVGAMANANELLGLMHAFYGVGGVLGPLIATSMITKLGLGWYAYYYVMIAVSAVELALLVSSFWPVTGRVFREAHPTTTGTGTGKGTSSMHEALWQMPAARVSWLCAAFLLCYVGVEVALGGWIVTFMIKVRQGAAFASGMTATGFWLGLTVGRVFFGFLTPKLGERLALMIYLPAAMGLELLFWLVPQFIVSAVAIALVGFFLGPLFPAVIIAVSKSLPKHLHVSAIGFAAAFGGGGGAVLPFAVGAIAQSKGVAVLQPIVLALLAVQLMLWLALPKFSKKRD